MLFDSTQKIFVVQPYVVGGAIYFIIKCYQES